ncbi:MAG: hypothetical protein QOF71_1708 [Candidatus Eremiobacteraeota bacterium]|jgi:hypothetical protein|nr:hypothetical protein [Candidatus Eremiobacteraeota bacterium]
MRVVLAVVVALGVNAVTFGTASAAAPGFTDAICPEGTRYVLEVGKMRTDDPPERIYAAAHAAAQAYATCSTQKLAYGFREAQHYADVRRAGFGIVAARALIAMRRFDEARAELVRDREMAQNVVDWITETQAYGSANVHVEQVAIAGDHRPSMYRAAARDVVVSADEALAELARTAEVPRRQGSRPSPSPAPTTRP